MNAGLDAMACACGMTFQTPDSRHVSAHHLLCHGCGVLLRPVIPSEEAIAEQYRRNYWDVFSHEQVSAARDNIYRHALARIQAYHGSPGTLVDVGCGAGRLLRYAQSLGWQGVGFELSEQAAEYGTAWGATIYRQSWLPCPLPDESVDAVSMVNVLDHLPRPFEALSEARRVLRPGGLLYVRVPNGPLHARLSKVAFLLGVPDFTVTHLYGFGKRAFHCHLPRLGFAQVEVRTSPSSRADAYPHAGFSAILRRICKRVDYQFTLVFGLLGLNRFAWGLSLEVTAVKTADD